MVIWLLGVACVPRAQLSWSTAPDVGEPGWRYAVLDPVDGEVSASAIAGLTSTVAEVGRLRPSCADGADATLRITRLWTEERVRTSTRSDDGLALQLPSVTRDLVRREPPLASPDRAVATWQGRAHVSFEVRRCDGTLVQAVTDATVAGSRAVSGPDVDAARAAVPAGALDDVVRATGHAVARHIVPTRGRASRRWFRNGDPRLRLAGAAVRAGHWQGAAATWHEVLADPEVAPSVRARALHDVALYHEVRGRLSQAVRSIRDAENTAALPPILRYRIALERAWTTQRSLWPHTPLPEEGMRHDRRD